MYSAQLETTSILPGCQTFKRAIISTLGGLLQPAEPALQVVESLGVRSTRFVAQLVAMGLDSGGLGFCAWPSAG